MRFICIPFGLQVKHLEDLLQQSLLTFLESLPSV